MDTEGTHLLLEYWGCDALALGDVKGVEAMMCEAAAAAGTRPADALFHKFDSFDASQIPGVSGVVVASGAHLTIHTWPEHGYAAVDVYVCNGRQLAKADKVIKAGLRSFDVQGMTVRRGLKLASGSMRIETG